jgi:CRP-like cAMP-binding protein
MIPIPETDQDFFCDIQAPCFQMLTAQEVELVKESKTQVLFRKGDNLTKQGTFASYVLFVINGLAKQYIEDGRTRCFSIRIIGPGEFVGLSTVFTAKTFNYSSVALTDCQVVLVEKVAIAKLVQQNGPFGYSLTKRYSEQNANLFETLQKVLFKQMNGRMAETLLYLDEVKSLHPEIFQLLSRKDLADFAGTSTESAVKLLKSFEKDGLIKLHDKDLEVLDKSKLDQIRKIG